MMKSFIFRTSILLFSFLMSCTMEQLEDLSQGRGNLRKSRLLEFVYNNRHYQFFYNSSGGVDSIRVHSDPSLLYTYVMTYANSRLAAVRLVDDGEVAAVNNGFVYDKKNRIIAYTYTFYLPDVPEGISTEVQVGYDHKGRMVSLAENSLTYDNRNNIITWAGPTPHHYTYDQEHNPLNGVENFFVMLVEEPLFWDFILSQHNSTSKSYPDGSTTTYQNQYDGYQRLIRKTGTRNGEIVDDFFFTYKE